MRLSVWGWVWGWQYEAESVRLSVKAVNSFHACNYIGQMIPAAIFAWTNWHQQVRWSILHNCLHFLGAFNGTQFSLRAQIVFYSSPIRNWTHDHQQTCYPQSNSSFCIRLDWPYRHLFRKGVLQLLRIKLRFIVMVIMLTTSPTEHWPAYKTMIASTICPKMWKGHL